MGLATQHLELRDDAGVEQVEQGARELAGALGFDQTEQLRIATAVSTAAGHVLRRQGWAQVVVTTVMTRARKGIECTCRDGQSFDTIGGGPLDEIRPLVDELFVEARRGHGTAVVIRSWVR